MVIEGVLAETGYYGFSRTLKENGLMPGLVEGIGYVQRDEARHIAFGIYLLQRLVRQDHAIWDLIQRRLNELLPIATGVIHETFAVYGEETPFGLKVEDFIGYAAKQFDFRVQAIERALP